MKKAYVKPMFFAEEFVAQENYAATGCGTFSWDPTAIAPGDNICAKVSNDGSFASDGHVIEHNDRALIKGNYSEGVSYWEYAAQEDRPGASSEGFAASGTYLFNSSTKVCDFVWDNTASDVGVWRPEEKENGVIDWVVSAVGKFGPFFLGPSADIKNHHPMYNSRLIPS